MRTPELPLFIQSLSELNNQFSLINFTHEQFYIDHDDDLQQKDKLTIDCFAENKYSKRYATSLNNVLALRFESGQFILKSFYVLSVVNFEAYLRDAFNFLISLEPEFQQPTKSIYRHIINVFDNSISSEIKSTMEYIFYRRNSYMHRKIDTYEQGAIRDLIKREGYKLNHFWKSKDVKLDALDFASKSIKELNHDVVIQLIAVLHRLAEEIDDIICSKIDNRSICQYLRDIFLCRYPKLSLNSSDVVSRRKLAHTAQMELGMPSTEIDYDQILRS